MDQDNTVVEHKLSHMEPATLLVLNFTVTMIVGTILLPILTFSLSQWGVVELSRTIILIKQVKIELTSNKKVK